MFSYANYLITKKISLVIYYIQEEPSFENEIKSLGYEELLHLGEVACGFNRKVVKETLDEKKGNIEDSANVIVTAMCDEFLNREEAYQRLPSIFQKISKCNSNNIYFIYRKKNLKYSKYC